MVGFKTFWILISSLILFAACVPQTKQSECGSNEAFNASLRTCVPVVGGSSSFINISSYTPMFTQTRSKDDTTNLTFTIAVSNPYNQSYSVEWERVFNAGPVTMCSNALTCSFPASLLGTTLGEVGTHILTAKIKDGNGSVVDSHSFELKINQLPRPVINTGTMQPISFSYTKYPTDPRVEFSFTVNNNNSTMSVTQNYRTDWTVIKNGTTIHTEADAFTNFGPTGSNIAYLGSSPLPEFNPANLMKYGVGSYIVRAVVQNDTPGEIVAEQQWSILVKQPDLAKVTTVSLPAPGVNTIAHNGVDYNDFPALSWVYGASNLQPNFCITVNDRDGTYSADGKSIQVKFYLDSVGGEICTKTTLDTPGSQTICLVDANVCTGSAAIFDTSLLRFNNTSSTQQQSHKVTARLYDEATALEFGPSNLEPSAGTYPIEWGIQVNPINVAPVITFGPAASNPTGCATSGAYAKSNCQVNQGQDFTVSFVTTDDFYTAFANPGEFNWDVKLKMNGSDLSTPPFITGCEKAFGATTPVATATNVWTCTLRVPHYQSIGALSPVGPFQVVATMQDSGSPIGGLGLVSQSLTWNLVVTETNAITPNIVISAQSTLASTSHISRDTPLPITYLDPAGSNYATETESISFKIGVRDPELDNFQYSIYRCGAGSTAATCVTPTMITASAINYLRVLYPAATLPFTDTVYTDPVLVSALVYQLPENLLLNIGADVDKVTNVPVYFRIDVADRPTTLPLASVKTDSKIFTINVRNYNPAPVINVAGANPAINLSTTSYPVVSGFPFSINPGTITDASTNTDESTVIYQWYATGDGGTSWFQIPGGTQKNLTWTPDQGAPATIELKLCVGDRPAANPILSPIAGGNCTTGSWFISPKSYLAKPTPAAPSVNVSSEVAVWVDTNDGDPTVDVIYSAYVGADNHIYVNKTVRDATFALNTSFQTVKITSQKDGTAANTVKNISLSGNANNLYIAYMASHPSTPGNLIPRLRRIDKSYDASLIGQKTGFPHKGKFGFSYNGFTIVPSGSCTTCTVTPGTDLSSPTIAFSAGAPIGSSISINGYAFTASANPTAANEFCGVGTCGAVDAAASLAAKINASTDSALNGITAAPTSPGATSIALNGQSQFDYIDWDGSYSTSLTVGGTGFGKMFVIGNYWFIPMINAILPGDQQNNITVLNGATTSPTLQNAGTSIDNTDVLTNIGQVAAFDAKLNANDNLIIASISADVTTAGRATLSRFALAGLRNFEPTTGTSQIGLFGTRLFQDIKVAADTTGNTSIFVLAKERTSDGGEWNAGRYTSTLAGIPSENFITDQLTTTDNTDDYIDNTIMLKPEIIAVPNSSDARLFFNSVGIPAGVSGTRMARWKYDNTFSCGLCAPIGSTGVTSLFVLSNVVIDTTLGTAGYVVNENQKDVAYVFTNYLNTTTYDSQLSLINLETETIQSTNIDTVNHLWRVPFAK
jgi:hypothetical protein